MKKLKIEGMVSDETYYIFKTLKKMGRDESQLLTHLMSLEFHRYVQSDDYSEPDDDEIIFLKELNRFMKK